MRGSASIPVIAFTVNSVESSVPDVRKLIDRGSLATVREELRLPAVADTCDNERQKSCITERSTSQVNSGAKVVSLCVSTTP